MPETEKPTMSRYNQILLTIMNELDRTIEKISVLSCDELGLMHGGFVANENEDDSESSDCNKNVNVNVYEGARCRCACT